MVTASGRPSGTAQVIRLTIIMKYPTHWVKLAATFYLPCTKNLITKTMKTAADIITPTIDIILAKSSSFS